MARLKRTASDKLFAEAQGLIPGGVNSPVRAFTSVGAEPFFVRSGDGAVITDVDGNTYVDYVQSWGALLFGHAHPQIVQAVSEAAQRGTSFGTPSELEVELARLVVLRRDGGASRVVDPQRAAVAIALRRGEGK